MQTDVAGARARLTVVMFPYQPQFEALRAENRRDEVLYPQREMERVTAEAGVPLLNLYPFFARNGGASLFRDLVHLTEEGHRLTAQAVVEHLEHLGWLVSEGRSDSPLRR
jgi:lysophospholipase L1-like esterase